MAASSARIFVMRTALLAVLLVRCGDAFAQDYRERSSIRSGNRAYEEQDYKGSEEKYRAALGKQPASYEAAFNLGDALYKQGRYEESSQVFDSLSRSPLLSAEQMSRVYHNMGNALFAQQKLQEAAESYKQSLRARPDDLETKYNLAYVQKLLEDQQQNQQNNQDNQNNQSQQDDQNRQGDSGQNQQNQDQQNQQNGDDGQDNNDEGQNDRNNDDRNRQGDNDSNNGQNDRNDQNGDGDRRQDNDRPDNESGDNPDRRDGDGHRQPREGQISREDAENILDALQQQEDRTREKVNAQRAVGVAASGKNW